MPELTAGALELRGPSAVGLRRLSARLSFPAGGEALYRSVLRQASLSPDAEFLLVPSGRGRSARFIAEATGGPGTGVDPDAQMVAVATERAKLKNLANRLHFEQAPLDDLPYQDDVFDLVLGEIEVAAAPDPGAVLGEMVRVGRPGALLVLIQLVWLRPVEDERRESLVERLGVRPFMVVEWKQMLRAAGVEDAQVEDWSDLAGPSPRLPLVGGLAELFSVRGKLWLLPRAWRRWGWRGVQAVLAPEHDLRRLLDEDRVLGVVVIRGRIGGTKGGEDDEEHGE